MKRPLEEIAIKEAKVFLKTVSEGLKALAKGVETLAKQVDTLAESQADGTAAPKTAAKKPVKTAVKRKAASLKKEKPATTLEKEKPATALETVFGLISRSEQGISTAALSEKTGYDKKKIHNAIYRLKKQGKIKAIRKGVYVKAQPG